MLFSLVDSGKSRIVVTLTGHAAFYRICLEQAIKTNTLDQCSNSRTRHLLVLRVASSHFRQSCRHQSSSVAVIRYQVVLASPSPSAYQCSMNALEIAARNFVISPKAGRQLERHRATVLMLRAKDATFSQIQDLLAQHTVTVSESSITRFCRKHRAEIKRLRLQLEQELDSPSPSAIVTAPPSIQSRKMRDLRGPV